MCLSPQSFSEMLFSVVQTSKYCKNLLRLNAASESSFLVPWILDIFNFEDDSLQGRIHKNKPASVFERNALEICLVRIKMKKECLRRECREDEAETKTKTTKTN